MIIGLTGKNAGERGSCVVPPPVAYLSLAQVYEAKGMYEAAIDESRKAYALLGDEETAALFENAKGAAGYAAVKREITLSNLERPERVCKRKLRFPCRFAPLYAQLNEKTRLSHGSRKPIRSIRLRWLTSS